MPSLKQIKNTLEKNKMYVSDNVDKKCHEKWGDSNHPTDDFWNCPAPARILILGLPNSGKSEIVKHLLCHAKPAIDYLFMIHPACWDSTSKKNDDVLTLDDIIDSKLTNIPEYDGACCIYLKTIPPLKFWEQFKGKKNYLVIDDVDLKSFVAKSHKRKERLNKLFSYVSTHYKLTIISSFQDIYSQGLSIIYRFSNMFILFKINDKRIRTLLGGNCGVEKNEMSDLMNLIKTSHDSITIDLTNDTPCKYRFNISTPIEFGKGDESEEEAQVDLNDEEDSDF